MVMQSIHTNSASNLGRNISELMRSSAELHTQAKLAARVNVSQTTIGRVLNGTINPGSRLLADLAAAFDVPVDALLLEREQFQQLLQAGTFGPDAVRDVREQQALYAASLPALVRRLRIELQRLDAPLREAALALITVMLRAEDQRTVDAAMSGLENLAPRAARTD